MFRKKEDSLLASPLRQNKKKIQCTPTLFHKEKRNRRTKFLNILFLNKVCMEGGPVKLSEVSDLRLASWESILVPKYLFKICGCALFHYLYLCICSYK